MKLTNIRLLTDNFEEMFDFYHDNLQVKCVFGERNGNYADFDLAGIYVSLFDKQLMAEALELNSQFVGYNKQMMIVEADDLESLYNTLKDNVNVLDSPIERQAWGIKCFHITDPDDNIIEFYTAL